MDCYEVKQKELLQEMIELKDHIAQTPGYTQSQQDHLKYKHLIDEQFAKCILANKIIDDKIKTSDETRYVDLRKAIEAKDSFTEFSLRKFAYFYEMEQIRGNWKVSWEDEIRTYYKNLPYHDEVNVILDGKHIIIPKKVWDEEQAKKALAECKIEHIITDMNESMKEKGLPPVELCSAQKLNDAAHTNEHTNASS